MGSDTLKLVLPNSKTGTISCSYPNQFNDPYELFLTMNFKQSPELLAYYKEVIGELPQLPVTCFSKNPDVIPMWAHYGHTHKGIVLEFDESKLLEAFPEAKCEDIDYRDKANGLIEDLLHRAFSIGKPRYHFFLQQGVFRTAYFTKHTCWSYEIERRLVVNDEDIKEVNGMKLLNFPVSCVSSIIVGTDASDETKELAKNIADEIDIQYYEMKIGKSSITPYFTNLSEQTFTFNDDSLKEVPNICETCKEPIEDYNETCSWCSINNEMELSAAQNNPLQLMNAAGVLDKWYTSMLDVGKSK